MNRSVLTFTLLLSAAPLWPADQAASLSDDSTVREIRLYFDDPSWYNNLYQSHNSNPADPYFPARLQYGDIVLPKIGVRFKGNSSFRRNGIKKSFKLDFNEYDDNASLLGLKKLNLNNGDLQPDFLHEKLFLDFAGKYIAAMRAAHIRVYVNDVYYGLYIAIEQPDKTMMQSRFGDDEDGNLFEAGESAAATMAYLGTNPSSYTSRYELKTNETENDYSGLIELLDVLNNTPAATLPSKLEPLMDVENVLYGMALNALFTNLESYAGTASEYFLYDRTSDGKFIHIHWDLNETFGSTGDGTPRLTNPFTMDPFYLPTGNNSARPLLEKLWAVNAYKRLYLQMLARMLREGFDEQTVSLRVQELANRIRADYSADPNKTYTNAQFETALTSQVTVNNFTTYGLTQFVRERVNYLRPLLQANAQPSDVRLNEVVAVNDGSQRDSAGDADPWVEVHNLGPGTVTTSGFYLSDDPANPTKWALPARTLADGEFLVLWLDGETNEGETHASFRASAAGGSLYLYASGAGMGTAIDTVQYPAVGAGQSYARMGNYGAQWSVTATPTSGAANSVTTVPVPTNPGAGTRLLVINELMADNDGAFPDPDEPGAYEDWFEVYNSGPAAVDMSGMYITDNLNNPVKWKVPDGVTVPAGGYLVFLADGETAQGSQHTSWSLSADGESIGIFHTDGVTLIDSVTFGPQRTDVAYGRTTDGSEDWSLFTPGTPGAANALPLANWIVNGASVQLGLVAPESVASVFGQGLAAATVSAESTTLPESLGGVTVTVTDSANAARPAGLYFVSPNQVNFLIPAGTVKGRANVAIRKQDGTVLAGGILVDPIAAGLFSANGNGQGVGLMSAIRTDGQGSQTTVPVFQFDVALQKVVAAPVSLGSASEQVYLVLYGTGLRGVAAVSDVSVQVGGTSVPVTYAAAQGSYAGLDQINLGPLPRSLEGKGEVQVVLTVDGNRTNVVTLTIQ